MAKVDYKGKRAGDGLDRTLMNANAKAKADHLNGIFREYESYVKAQAMKQSMAMSGNAIIDANMRQGAELDSKVHVDDWMGEPNSKFVNTSEKQSDKMDLRGMFGQSQANKTPQTGKQQNPKQEKQLSGKELCEMKLKNPTAEQKQLIKDYLNSCKNDEDLF